MPKSKKRRSEKWLETRLLNLLDRVLMNKGGRVNTFEEVGMMTRDKGLVIHLNNGQTFDLTIQESSERMR